MATPVKYRNGLIGTCLFHSMLLFLLMYMAFSTPLPLPAEQGILVDFGNSNTGFGDFEPRMSDPAPVQSQPAASTANQSEQQTLTQDIEESVALPDKPKEQPKEQPKQTQNQATNQTPKDTPPVESPIPVERTVDARAMYPGRGDPSSTATSQGEAGGQGNQGVPTGAPDVHVYGEGGDVGGGNRFVLSGRNLVGRLPRPDYNVRDEGVVVVSIIVDKDGNVTRATYTSRGSTTLNQTLITAAEKAALQAKFTRNPNAVEQTGTITYTFKLGE